MCMCAKSYFMVHPEVEEFKDLPETVFIRVAPKWIRVSDYSCSLLRIEEIVV